MLAIGNNELGETVKKGDKLVNQKGDIGILEYGTDNEGKESSMLGFVKIGEHCYLASIRDRLMSTWEKYNE